MVVGSAQLCRAAGRVGRQRGFAAAILYLDCRGLWMRLSRSPVHVSQRRPTLRRLAAQVAHLSTARAPSLSVLCGHLDRGSRPLATAPRAGAGRDGRSRSAARAARSGSVARLPRGSPATACSPAPGRGGWSCRASARPVVGKDHVARLLPPHDDVILPHGALYGLQACPDQSAK